MNEPIIDWKAITPLNGSRAKGFEELCAQIARSESPDDSRFERKGTPDAGVECYTVFNDGSEWGWQAKYFDNLGDSQWPQLDHSVNRALKKHPKLVRYFICVPLDRPDARIDGRKSAKERWEDHLKTWTDSASSLGMTVEFVYWGNSELLELLVHPKNLGRVRFWFDIHGFDIDWCKARLEESLKTAGPRYTPEINIDLPIAQELEIFGRTEHFFERIKSQAQVIRGGLRDLDYHKPKYHDQTLDTEKSKLSSEIQIILSEFGAITTQPTGILPFKKINDLINKTGVTISKLEDILLKCEQEHDAKLQIDQVNSTPLTKRNPFREYRYVLSALSSVLEDTHELLEHADKVASSSIMLLKGTAGTGKTHLLCDVARRRIETGKPTVLLMGQRFTSTNDPWLQVLQQLDIAAISAEECVGVLEAAAQVAGCRLLFMIDAINEGAGRLIWPNHLSAFIAQIERSQWIGVLLSVRTPYEEILIPEGIRARAITVIHQGFTDHEYDATRTFFTHYNLELPSTPLLSPEFSNPLFLKTLCRGLNAKGENRLPRGFFGFSAIFNLYLNSTNDRLAQLLGFNPKHFLVQQALEKIAEAMVDSEDHWLSLTQAEKIVNDLLPDREFERSLYRGLIIEGILIEHVISQQDKTTQEVVAIAYERLTDHLVTKILLDKYLNMDDPSSSFKPGAPLAFIWDKSRYITTGFLEAMCIQVAERTKQELALLAPNILDRWGIGDAFRQSLIWRDTSAFSEGTLGVLNKLIRNRQDSDDTLDVLLTVASLPEHPYNADFLDRRLRKDAMPDRDAWWNIYLHYAWNTHGAVDRLVHWASSVKHNSVIDRRVVDLCATALTWMLSSSNRFLRDNATQALVNLLTGRLDAVKWLIERFKDVDDTYIAERLYAVAYGIVMRSNQPDQVGALAQYVYNLVFISGAPPVHILLRDYARGIIERSLFLGAKMDITEENIRPPYQSQWPTIPSEDEIKPFLPDWSRGSHDRRDTEWARNRIGSSVMSDDFAHYVISTKWTSLHLEEPPWQSPDSRISALAKKLSTKERAAWSEYQKAHDAVVQMPMKQILIKIQRTQGDEESQVENGTVEGKEILDPEMASAIEARDAALKRLDSVLTSQHRDELLKLLNERDDVNLRYPPRFDIGLIQRYILKRVFDLGWTVERFGEFDRFTIGYKGREAAKAERIGKKYQWIAYHEIMALVADHFKYGERFTNDIAGQYYEGPWQDHFRDIDPSCTLKGSSKNSSWDAHSPAWWCPVSYEDWGNPDDASSWLSCCDDLPKVENLLSIYNPRDNTKWLNLQSFFLWKQPAPSDQDRYDIARRELWYIINGYLIYQKDQETFMKWAENVDFSGRWMPDPVEEYKMFLGEYGWSPAFQYFQKQYFHDIGDNMWTQPDHGCAVKVKSVAFEYLREAGRFDCSVDDSYKLLLPNEEILTSLSLRWSGSGSEFVDDAGHPVVFDPTAQENGPQALLFKQDCLKEFLKREGLSFCWTILGEKMAVGPGYGDVLGTLRLSGAYTLVDEGLSGFIKSDLSIPDGNE